MFQTQKNMTIRICLYYRGNSLILAYEFCQQFHGGSRISWSGYAFCSFGSSLPLYNCLVDHLLEGVEHLPSPEQIFRKRETFWNGMEFQEICLKIFLLQRPSTGSNVKMNNRCTEIINATLLHSITLMGYISPNRKDLVFPKCRQWSQNDGEQCLRQA